MTIVSEDFSFINKELLFKFFCYIEILKESHYCEFTFRFLLNHMRIFTRSFEFL